LTTTPRILIVDDSLNSQHLLSAILQKGNYDVTCASTGEQALQALRDQSFNLVLTEVIMPGISGLNLLKMIKESSADTDVVIVTSNASSFTAIRALRLGAYDFIIKPVDDEAILYNVVERALEKQNLTFENRRLISDLSEKNRALSRAVDMMKTVNGVCALMASSLDIADILRKLVESAVEQLNAKKGYLLLLDKAGNSFSMKVWVGIEPQLAKNFTMPYDKGISGLVAAKNRPLRIGTDIPQALTPKVFEEDMSGELFTTPGILSVPLQINGKVAGVVNISGRLDGTPFDDPEVEFMTTLANHAAIAINNAGSLYKMKKGGQ
jgi:CheY-like chemotaxis protein